MPLYCGSAIYDYNVYEFNLIKNVTKLLSATKKDIMNDQKNVYFICFFLIIN